MSETVTSYHPTVTRTGSEICDLIAGTACFPGGSGLWRGPGNGGKLPESFPHLPVMFIAHNFDSQKAFQVSLANRGEAGGQFWQRLQGFLAAADLTPAECFFTNVLMGLKPGSATGAMPSVPGYREQCLQYLIKQVEIVRPRAVIALGVKAEKYVAKLSGWSMAARHPSDWHFRDLVTRDQRLHDEGKCIGEFVRSVSYKL